MQVRKQNDKKSNAFFQMLLAFVILLLFLACNGFVTWVSNWLASQK